MRRTVGRLRTRSSCSASSPVRWVRSAPRVAPGGEARHRGRHDRGDGVMGVAAAVAVGQGRGAVRAVRGEQAAGVAFAEVHQRGGAAHARPAGLRRVVRDRVLAWSAARGAVHRATLPGLPRGCRGAAKHVLTPDHGSRARTGHSVASGPARVAICSVIRDRGPANGIAIPFGITVPICRPRRLSANPRRARKPSPAR